MIVFHLFGAIMSAIVIVQGLRSNSIAFELLGAAFLALNLGLALGAVA